MKYAIQYQYEDGWWSDPEWCDDAEEAIDYIRSVEEDEDEDE